MKKLHFFLLALLASMIGIYPLLYFVVDMSNEGLLGGKPPQLFQNHLWHFLFYTHIALGGIALLTGWSQFSEKLRKKRLNLHRNLGKIYVISVLLSGIAGLYIALYATGGIITILGFATLAVLWLFTTFKAYTAIQQKQITAHQQWMIRSYALTFGAVTLRIWLPFLQGVLGMTFINAYLIVAWLAWIPNLLFAEWLVRKDELLEYGKKFD
ncbi:MAG: DUF2306 domain-containing protein [Chitinophagales bacterium]